MSLPVLIDKDNDSNQALDNSLRPVTILPEATENDYAGTDTDVSE